MCVAHVQLMMLDQTSSDRTGIPPECVMNALTDGMVIQVEEVGAQEVRGRSGGRPRSTKAASLSTAGPSSPAASWDSGAGQTQPKKLPHYISSQQQYALEPEPATSYGQVHSWMLSKLACCSCQRAEQVRLSWGIAA